MFAMKNKQGTEQSGTGKGSDDKESKFTGPDDMTN